MTENFDIDKTDSRRVNLIYNFPIIRMKCVTIELTQKDIITIIRQINNTKIRKQLTDFVQAVDDWSEYDTDVENQPIQRNNLMRNYEREVMKYEDKKHA